MPETAHNNDVLLKEYDHRFQEMIFHSERYHKQADILNFFITSIIAVGALTFSYRPNTLQDSFLFLPKLNLTRVSHAGFLIFGALLVFFFFSSIMNALFMIYLNGARIAAIEKRLNKAVGEEILTWDSKAMPYFFNTRSTVRQNWVTPTILAGIWIFAIFLLICASLCFLCFEFLPTLSLYYIPIVATLAFFHMHQWILLNTAGLEEIRSYFIFNTGKSFIGFQVDGFFYVLGCFFYILPIFSVLIMILSSLQWHAFWFTSIYTFPLISTPSIYIGDLLILPIINYKIVRWFTQFGSFRKFILKFRLLSIAIAIIVIIINSLIHYLWIHDPWTGFMDTAYGKLTVAGWDHLIFSSVEMWLIAFFTISWLSWRRIATERLQSKGVWRLLLVFYSLGIVDLAIKYFHVFRFRQESWHPCRELLIALLPLCGTTFIYLWSNSISCPDNR